MAAALGRHQGQRRVEAFPDRTGGTLIRAFLRSKSAYKDYPGQLADPWNAIDKKWGDHRPDGNQA